MLRTLILELCRRREWTTAGQFARWFPMNKRSLVKRHLGPMVDAGVLELRFLDRLQSPKEGYRAGQDPRRRIPTPFPPRPQRADLPDSDPRSARLPRDITIVYC